VLTDALGSLGKRLVVPLKASTLRYQRIDGLWRWGRRWSWARHPRDSPPQPHYLV
jgi:hypothetical protein